MPRRYFDYAPRFEIYNQISTIGAAFIGVSMLLTLWYLLWAIKKGKPAPANPWGAVTLDWQMPPIPGPHNFEEAPVVGDPYDMELFTWSEEEGGFVPRNPVPGNPYQAMPRSAVWSWVLATTMPSS